MQRNQRGFTLIELIAVVILISLLSVTAMSRFTSLHTTKVQAGRDDVIAACFFAQQAAMARSSIKMVVTSTSVSVTENNVPISIGQLNYPLSFSSGVTASVSPASSATFTFDKLGRTTAGTVTLTASGVSATVVVEGSGYAH